ncbi:MAG: hypothetical protein ACE5OR_15005, partial [bacterium]
MAQQNRNLQPVIATLNPGLSPEPVLSLFQEQACPVEQSILRVYGVVSRETISPLGVENYYEMFRKKRKFDQASGIGELPAPLQTFAHPCTFANFGKFGYPPCPFELCKALLPSDRISGFSL